MGNGIQRQPTQETRRGVTHCHGGPGMGIFMNSHCRQQGGNPVNHVYIKTEHERPPSMCRLHGRITR